MTTGDSVQEIREEHRKAEAYNKIKAGEQDELLLTENDLPWLYDFTVTKGNIDSVLEAQIAKAKQHYEQKIQEVNSTGYAKGEREGRRRQVESDRHSRLDRPDREKIARQLAEGDGWIWNKMPRHYDPQRMLVSPQSVYYSKADQILALIPDIEEVKREERDYVVSWLDDIFLCEFYNAEQRDDLCRSMWQALKEGK